MAQQAPDTMIAVRIDEIILSDIRSNGQLPWSSDKTKITTNDLFQNNVRILIDRNAGIQSFNGENFAQDVRIAIRGYGSRSAFGIRGIKIYQDGLPLTSPDGTSQLDEISIFDIESIDIVRSGIAARLGNAAGGALSFKMANYFDGLQLLTRLNALGAYDAGIKYGIIKNKVQNVLSLNHHTFQSKRAFSHAKNTTLLNKTRYDISKKWQINLTHGVYYSPLGKDPGALNAEEFAVNRYQANPRNIAFEAGESVSGLLASGKSILAITDQSTLISGYFYRYRDFTGRLPFVDGGWVDLNRHFGGISNTYEFRSKSKLILSLGHILELQSDRRILSANINGMKSNTSVDQFEKVTNTALFQQLQYLKHKWILHQMLRWDFNQFKLKNNMKLSGINDDDKRYNNLNGSLGIGYIANKNLTIYANVNTTFETPTLNELSNNPDLNTGFNPSLKPESSLQKEIGFKWAPISAFSMEVSGFHIFIDNQITGYELKDAPGRTFYRNATSTIRKGLECTMDISLHRRAHLNLIYTFSEFKYLKFLSGASDFSGHYAPLIPTHRWTARAMLQPHDWIDIQINIAYNSKIYVDDANLTTVKPFCEINGVLSSGKSVSSHITFGITANNLFSLMNYSNFRVNATFGRYFEAASPQHFGIFLKYVY